MSGGTSAAALRWARVCAVLDAILETGEEERPRILAEHCADDHSLRIEIETLLLAEARIGRRLETPLLERAGRLLANNVLQAAPTDHASGESIGPWRLIEELGRGGMGTVWLAERANGAFEQRVALKLLKRGLDSDAILNRFLAERRILARLAHPNIARLIDGGMTGAGRPYFAMELVSGEPITRWCDAAKLSVRERVQRFLSVIDAVQHAHGQLIIHRDLKPSNILVTTAGDAKLLDFGIAKLLDHAGASADSATLTQLGWRMLTPEYAAPEQLRGEPVTTATDIYSLGVLLHELLTGRRPSPVQGDASSVETTTKPPPRPSGQIADAASLTRSTSAERLKRALRGDLDTILLRALHPEPERRYGSAEAFREDLRRYLDNQPINARPDSPWYRTRKFVIRNRAVVATTLTVVIALAVGLTIATWQAREARLQAQRADQIKEFLVKTFEAGSPLEWRGKEPTARDLLDAGTKRIDEELIGEPGLHAEMLAIIGALHLDQGHLDAAETLLRRALDERHRLFGEDHEAYADSLDKWSSLLFRKGKLKEAEQASAHSVAILQRRLGDDPRTAAALNRLSVIRLGLGNVDEAIRLHRQALAMYRRANGNDHVSVADSLRNLGSLLVEKEHYTEASPLFEEALAIYGKLYGIRSARYATGLNAQAILLHKQGKIERAATAYRQAAGIYQYAGDPGDYEDAINHYGLALCQLGRFGEAERNLRESVELLRRNRAAISRRLGIRLVSLGGCLTEAGRAAEAEPLLREGLATIERDVGPKHAWMPIALIKLAESLADLGRTEEASRLAEHALRLFRHQFGPDSARTADGLRILAGLRFESGERRTGVALANQAVQIMRSAHGPDHPRTAAAILELAKLELRIARDQQAERRLDRIIPIFDAAGDKPKALAARMLRGVALARLGHPLEGEKLLQYVAFERRRMYGTSNPKTVEAEAYLSACSASRKRSEERCLRENGLPILARAPDANHKAVPRLASTERTRPR